MSNNIIAPAVGYRIEGAGGDSAPQFVDCNIPNLTQGVFDLSDNDTKYYRDYFLNKPHLNFLTAEGPRGPASVSTVKDDDDTYRSLIRLPTGNERRVTPGASIRPSWWRKLVRASPSPQDILHGVAPELPPLKFVSDARLPQTLITLEEKQNIKGFKFGILYAQEGQTKEDEMFSNIDASPEFEEFLDFIGERVPLNGWPNFRAGLDVKTGTTGLYSIYHRWNNNEIMYHVSCMLPFNDKDKQQLERKRHIGNDIVVVVFQDGDTVYRPTTISSRQVHVVLVVKAVTLDTHPGERFYRLAVVSKDGVPEFGPPLVENALYRKNEDFKNFFYAKLLNAEKASYAAPILGNKLSRTRTALIKDVADTFCD